MKWKRCVAGGLLTVTVASETAWVPRDHDPALPENPHTHTGIERDLAVERVGVQVLLNTTAGRVVPIRATGCGSSLGTVSLKT